MRKIRIFAHISLDGVISPSGRGEDSDYAHGGWTVPFRTPARLLAEGAEQPDRGRSECRDEIRRDPQAGQPRMGSGRGPRRGRHGSRGIKSNGGPDLIVWGSSTLTSVLLEQGLVDEVVLFVYPVLLGRGKRFFSDGADPRERAFVSTKPTPSDVLMDICGHAGSLQSQPLPT
jgi:hypothetical protein